MVGVAEDELVHVPLAWTERREDGDTGGAELSFQCGSGAVGEVEVDAAGVLSHDKVGRGAEVDFEAVAGEEGVDVAVLITPGGEAEEAVEVDGASEIFDGKDGNEAEDRFVCHKSTLRNGDGFGDGSMKRDVRSVDGE